METHGLLKCVLRPFDRNNVHDEFIFTTMDTTCMLGSTCLICCLAGCLDIIYDYIIFHIHRYTIEGGELPGVAGCIVRALENMLSRDDVECRCVDQLSGVLTLEDNEERISNIIELKPLKESDDPVKVRYQA